mmetsp:Transcript_16755/g.39805  ORF Transcript_16755/g.39805 Transcript_16755/m.39805 type:complete len:348 (-) Transcript_16755:1177-2220(-)
MGASSCMQDTGQLRLNSGARHAAGALDSPPPVIISARSAHVWPNSDTHSALSEYLSRSRHSSSLGLRLMASISRPWSIRGYTRMSRSQRSDVLLSDAFGGTPIRTSARPLWDQLAISVQRNAAERRSVEIHLHAASVFREGTKAELQGIVPPYAVISEAVRDLAPHSRRAQADVVHAAALSEALGRPVESYHPATHRAFALALSCERRHEADTAFAAAPLAAAPEDHLIRAGVAPCPRPPGDRERVATSLREAAEGRGRRRRRRLGRRGVQERKPRRASDLPVRILGAGRGAGQVPCRHPVREGLEPLPIVGGVRGAARRLGVARVPRASVRRHVCQRPREPCNAEG